MLDLSGWHHALGVDPVERRELARRRTSMSAEENNMALSRRLMEARVKGDLDALDEMMSPDFVSHAKLLPDQQPDREGEKWLAVQLAAAFSNRRLLVEDEVAGGDKVVTRLYA
jgi:ketosteroid isomerase-like protein